MLLLVRKVFAVIIGQLIVFDLVLGVLVENCSSFIVRLVVFAFLLLFICSGFEQLLISNLLLLLREASADFLRGKIIGEPKRAFGVGSQAAPDRTFILRHGRLVPRSLFIDVPLNLVLLIYAARKLGAGALTYLTSCQR